MKTLLLAITVALFALRLPAAQAQAFSPIITQTVGTGANTSFFVINFEDGPNSANSPASDYAFAYHYNGSVTGFDFVNALSVAGLTSTFKTFSFGHQITQFTYGTHSQTGDGGPSSSGYWAYYVGPDGQNWSSSAVGADMRTLTNGSWDGWTWAANDNAVAPVTPNAAPEPSSVGIFALGASGLALLARRRVHRTSIR